MELKLIRKAARKYRQDGVLTLLKSLYRFISYRMLPRRVRLIYKSHLNFMINRIKYDAPANPYKTIWVNPAKIKYRSTDLSILNGLGQVKGGMWGREEHLEPIDEHLYVKGIYERFEQGKDWRNTVYVRHAEEKISEYGEMWGCETIGEFLTKRCNYVDELYEDIKNNGYNPESQSSSNRNKKFSGRKIFMQNLEPLVLIGGNGQVIWRDGYHRFAIADILGLTIPVNVVCRHQDWQLYRDKVSNARMSIGNKISHPDLENIS